MKPPPGRLALNIGPVLAGILVAVSLGKAHHSTAGIDAHGQFSINIPNTGSSNQIRIERMLRLFGVPYVAQSVRSLFLEAPVNDLLAHPTTPGLLFVATDVGNGSLVEAAVDDVVFGCANQAGEDNRNVARMALLLAGLPASVPGVTVKVFRPSSGFAALLGSCAKGTGPWASGPTTSKAKSVPS
mgnify:CR=1 FL=1